MITYHCDGCGAEIPQTTLRYTVEIDVRAAYDKLEVGLTDLVRDHRSEILALIEKLKHRPVHELEESIYAHMKLDLCPSCQRAFISNPLRFHPEQSIPEEEIDIDAFLRSLGFGTQGPEPEDA